MSDTAVTLTTKKDWSSDQEVRWCPGCGDYGVLKLFSRSCPNSESLLKTRYSSQVSAAPAASRTT